MTPEIMEQRKGIWNLKHGARDRNMEPEVMKSWSKKQVYDTSKVARDRDMEQEYGI